MFVPPFPLLLSPSLFERASSIVLPHIFTLLSHCSVAKHHLTLVVSHPTAIMAWRQSSPPSFRLQGFPSITLTLMHFIVTYIGLRVCARVGLFTPKRLDPCKVLPLALTFCGFVVFTNLSLTHNTVGFYQLAKTMTTPTIVVLQRVFFRKRFAWKILASLAAVCAGVALATQADTSYNERGAFFAVCGVLVTSLYQIWVKTKQEDLDASAWQLLYYQAPIAAGLLCFLVPVAEPPFQPGGVLGAEWSHEALAAVALSCVTAFAVNLSIFLVIGKTSPVTYNVLGHFKLCSILVGGFVLFGDELNGGQAQGIALALVGIFVYTYFKLSEQAPPKVAPLPTSVSKL